MFSYKLDKTSLLFPFTLSPGHQLKRLFGIVLKNKIFVYKKGLKELFRRSPELALASE
jgi:hypothetical protein